MSIYKPFTTSDVVITPFKVHKSFTFKGTSEFISSNVGIDRFFGKNTPYISGSNTTGEISTQNKTLIYESVKQLYYSNFLNGQDGSPANLAQFNNDGTITVQGGSGSYQPMYDNYLPNTLTANRLFPTGSNDIIGVISIPSNLFGESIKPGTFRWKGANQDVIDNGEGDLVIGTGFTTKIGNIIYQQGIGVITNLSEGRMEILIGGADITCSFQSTTTIYESQYKCTLRENEFNYTQNPSAISGRII